MKKDKYEEIAKPDEDGFGMSPELLNSIKEEGMGFVDVLIAGALGAIVWICLSIWEFPGLHPSVWHDVAVATGVRPADTLMPGFYTFLASICYSFGMGAGAFAMRILGHVSAACIAILIYALLREFLAFIMRARPQHGARRTFVMRLAAVVGSVAFVCSDPVWNAGECLSTTTIDLGLTLLGIEAFFLFLRKGTLVWAYLCALAMGLLAAETPMAFVLVLAFIVLNNMVLTKLPVFESPFFRPEVIAVGKWYMTTIFVLGLLVGVGLNIFTYMSHAGLDAAGKTIGDLPLDYLMGYKNLVCNAADIMGWCLLIGVCLMPFIVSLIRFPSAADEDEFLHYATGVVFIFCTLVAFTQSCALPDLWFWKYGAVHSAYLLSVGLLLLAFTIAAGVTILGVDSICRNHKALAQQIYGSEDDPDSKGEGRLSRLLRFAIIICVPVMILVGIIPGRIKTTTRTMLGIINDGIAETVREANGVPYLFTDGNLDTGVELAAAHAGHPIYCLSLMALDKNAVYLRTRGMKSEEDRFSFGHDAGMGLRSWIRDQPDKLKTCAAQMAFDLWKRDGKSLPPMGGMLSLPTGFPSAEEQERGIEAARALVNRVLTLYKNGGIKNCTEESIKNAFLAIEWRLSRMCFYRAEVYDLQGDAKNAIQEMEWHNELDKLNETYQKLVAGMSKRNEQMLSRITPREGLQLALVRADFTMGKLYAETILQGDPDNADANFAMGMYYLKERQLTRAEEYLKRCLIGHPNEPAVFNNLAMIQLELGKLEAAKLNADKALKILPDSTEVKETVKAIAEALAKRAEKK